MTTLREAALRAALAESVQEPVQEPVHEHEKWCASVTQLLLCDPPRKAPCNCKPTAPPQRKPLTDEEIKRIDDSTHFHESPDWSLRFARAVERAHGIGDSDE